MGRYAINFLRLIGWMLPTFLRRRVMIAWLHAVTKRLRDMHDEFIVWGREKKDEVQWNGQTGVLEQLLVRRFGPGIYIQNNKLDTNGTFMGIPGDAVSYMAVPGDASNYIGLGYNLSSFNFIVYVPSSIPFNRDEMEAVINKYKLYNTIFDIVII